MPSTRSALVLISHDRRFLEKVTRNTIWLDRGKTRRLDKGFAHFEEWRDTMLEEEELEHHKLGRQIEREEHWVRYGVTARRKRNMRRMGELADLRSSSATVKRPQAMSKCRLPIRARVRQTGASKPKAITKAFGDRTLVSAISPPASSAATASASSGRTAVGKTTLLKMLTGELAPDTGTLRLGVNLDIATLDQKREDADPEETLMHYLTDGRGDNLVDQRR